MKITRLESREQEIMQRLRDELDGPRPDGEHLTEAIWCNIKATVKPALAAAGIETPFDDATILRFTEGKMWEAALAKFEWRKQSVIAAPSGHGLGTVDAMRPRSRIVIEIKATSGSAFHDISDAMMMQVQGYASWLLPDGVEVLVAELRIIYKNGDGGKSKCKEHGYPEQVTRRENPDTGRQKLCCPVCKEFLFGERKPMLRVYEVEWTRDDLESMRDLIASRLNELRVDRAAYQVGDPLPTWKWGHPEKECAGCEVREAIGCPGRDGLDELEQELKGSIQALQAKELAGEPRR